MHTELPNPISSHQIIFKQISVLVIQLTTLLYSGIFHKTTHFPWSKNVKNFETIQLPEYLKNHLDIVCAQLHQTSQWGYMHAYTSCTIKHFIIANNHICYISEQEALLLQRDCAMHLTVEILLLQNIIFEKIASDK